MVCIYNICVCSYNIRSSHTSGRDVLNDYVGNCGYEFVRIGNLLASRLILLLILCSCRGCRWLVEQPEGRLCLTRSDSSNSWAWPKFLGSILFLCVCVSVASCMLHLAIVPSVFIKVYSTSFCMGAFNGKTPKRHRLWSNDWGLLQEIYEIGGHMSRAAMQSLPGQSLVKKYHDKNGKLRRVGIPARLKESQCLSCKLQHAVSCVNCECDCFFFNVHPGSGRTQHPLRTWLLVSLKHLQRRLGFMVA